jgi:hypothetical protein
VRDATIMCLIFSALFSRKAVEMRPRKVLSYHWLGHQESVWHFVLCSEQSVLCVGTQLSASAVRRLIGPSSCVTDHRDHSVTGGTLNTWRSGDDGRTVAERLQVRF